MRTTIAIDDHLLRSARKQAQRRGLTLGQFVEEALRRELSHRTGSGPGPPVPVFRKGRGVQPGVDLSSNRGLLEALDEGQPLERIR
ncbi:MAG TPA: antitoxin [Actinomycetota bacterium]